MGLRYRVIGPVVALYEGMLGLLEERASQLIGVHRCERRGREWLVFSSLSTEIRLSKGSRSPPLLWHGR